MGRAKKETEKRTLDILAGSGDDSNGAGEDLSKIQINEEYTRRFEHDKRREALPRDEERRKRGLLPASDDDDEEKSGKKSRSGKGPSSSEPDKGKPINDQEETDVKRKSTRSGRRKRRNGDLKMSRERQRAYGILNPKRPKSH